MKTSDNKPQHTPGPWRWEHHPMRKGVIALSAGQTDVILASGDGAWAWAEINEPNRKLISAAPELLQALKLLVDCIDGNYKEAGDIARTVIEKAEGRS